ncbi:unnamed protein product [Chrysoparadoxa australica]
MPFPQHQYGAQRAQHRGHPVHMPPPMQQQQQPQQPMHHQGAHASPRGFPFPQQMQRQGELAYRGPQKPPPPQSGPSHSMGMAQMASLQVNAAEFVPGRSNANSSPAPPSDLKAKAAEFVPGRKQGDSGPVDETAPVKMVQVIRDGMIFAVPEEEVEASEVVIEEEFEEEEGLQWTVGSGSLPAPAKHVLPSTSIPDNLWGWMQRRSLEMLKQLPPHDERLKEIPTKFSAAFPLDDAGRLRGQAGSFGYPSVTYKVTKHQEGSVYCLRRFDGPRTSANILGIALEAWSMLGPHPGLITPVEAFLHHGVVFFITPYFPCAETLAQRFVERQGQLLSEKALWNFVSQLVAAITVVHGAGMACRQIDPVHVLYVGSGRVKLNWLGVVDVLEFETRKKVSDLQAEDMAALGRLILSVGCRNRVAEGNLTDSLNFFQQHYSPDLHGLVSQLLQKSLQVFEVGCMIGPRVLEAFDGAMGAVDALQSHLMHEYDNGRMLRLLLKLGSVNERPEQDMNAQWSETGDRYLLKLFRDYLFHQVDEKGKAVQDFGHILHSLNKLDAGDTEQILLTSRDQQSILVASFADVKRCLEEAFGEVFPPP